MDEDDWSHEKMNNDTKAKARKRQNMIKQTKRRATVFINDLILTHQQSNKGQLDPVHRAHVSVNAESGYQPFCIQYQSVVFQSIIIMIITKICKAHTLRFKALNKQNIRHIMYIEMEM